MRTAGGGGGGATNEAGAGWGGGTNCHKIGLAKIEEDHMMCTNIFGPSIH
jgi:hypothetical protein